MNKIKEVWARGMGVWALENIRARGRKIAPLIEECMRMKAVPP